MIRKRSKQIIAALLFAALATSCSPEQDEIPGGSNAGGLRFEVQMANNWSSTSTGATSRAPIEGTAFPGSAAGTKYEIGLSILKDDGKTGYMEGAEFITAELTVKTHSPAVWRYKLKGKSEWLTELPREGLSQPLTISACYPCYQTTKIESGSTTSAFVLSATSEQADQTDVLYTIPKALNPDGVNVLDFKHFYALFEFQLKKRAALTDAITLNSVSFANAYGKRWVANQGWYNARTGIVNEGADLVIGAIHRTGLNLTLKPAMNSDLTDPAYQAVQVLVPPRAPGVMDSYADGNIQVHFDFGDKGMATFDIGSYYLFNSSIAGSNGITGGIKYTYKLIYDTRPDGVITLGLAPWSDNSADENMGMTPTILIFGATGTIKAGTFNGESHTITGGTTTSYNGVTTGPGGYKTTVATCIQFELPYQKLEIAKEDEPGTFSHDNARTACQSKTTDGGGWRLARMSEWVLILYNRAALKNTPGFVDFTNRSLYWSGTEKSTVLAWEACPSSSATEFTAQEFTKISSLYVRCVREVK